MAEDDVLRMTDGAFTPFFRRFKDERALELNETRSLYERVRDGCGPLSLESVARPIFHKMDLIPRSLERPFWTAICEVLRMESVVFDMPEIRWDVAQLTMQEQVNLRNFLRAKEYFLVHRERTLTALHEALLRVFWEVQDAAPQTEAPSPFTIPLIHTVTEPKVHLQRLFNTLVEDEYRHLGLFTAVVSRVYENICAENNVIPYTEHKKPLKSIFDSELPLEDLVRTFFAGTPFVDFYLTPVALKLTHEDRFSHMHVVGGSGAGKTTLLEHLILNDLAADDPPALIVIDSQSDLINKLSRLALFGGRLRDRFLLITPKDIHHPPALNIFDVNQDRLGSYDELTKEQVVAGVIQTFDYLFGGLLGADLTAKQGVFFRFVARLMLALPETMGRNATILDMIRLMDAPQDYQEAIRSLPPIQRAFFERDFVSKTFQPTKEQIRYRLNAILENPTLARLFTSPRTKVDLFRELNSGSIILVDTAKDFLKGASSHFGRIFISLVLQAILERAAIPEYARKPAFLVVDEAANYFDSNIDDLLTEARKYKLGCLFAHQFLDQAAPSLRASLAANTSIKMCAGVSTADARALAPEMRTTADFILGQPRLHFASYIRNVTPNAVSIPVQPGELGRQRLLSPEAYLDLLEDNRKRVSLPAIEYQRTEPAAPPPSPADERRPESSAKKRYQATHAPRKPEPPDEDGLPAKEW
jgi:hypothetical protein